MANLTRRRLQLGAQMLGSTSYSVAQIASEVGYESEAPFNPLSNASLKRLRTVPRPVEIDSCDRTGEAIPHTNRQPM
jgi:AraC-like DNA-binding protein